MPANMQPSWSREKYALNVRVQGFESKVIEPACRTLARFLAVVTISLSSAAIPAFPRLRLDLPTVKGEKVERLGSRAGAADDTGASFWLQFHSTWLLSQPNAENRVKMGRSVYM
ncbi:hypothetical protein AWB77_00458 [Caballeronia fortuita]|uniref:Uncharacterized protein n=1 Tax=Caballeronia fortuita TaxID=1777138 RepID=A0A157ZAC1_9BURK|nr:hypothetical protein AWB77_00458 [Caballeronia fortuita]